MDEEEKGYDEFWEDAESILPGTNLGFIDIENGVSSSPGLASAEINDDGDYNIYIVFDPDGDYSIEPEYSLLETVKSEEIKIWLKNHLLSENMLD